jgi:hypothetical protein
MKIHTPRTYFFLLGILSVSVANSVLADVVHSDDVIITSSACIGNDCVDGEDFGFDSLRFKENNLRIHFDDTSNSASFADRDWRIVINDTTNGGANYFAIEDATGGTVPFKVAAGSGNNALIVNASGHVGMGTAAPVVELHIVDGDTPTLRLEQDGSSGFTPLIWDLASNETNFFIRDVTNGSKLPFRIRPGAPQSSIDIAADGKVGMGTDSPQSRLHVKSTAGKADLRLQSFSSPNTPNWLITNNDDELRFSIPGSGVVEGALNSVGDFTTTGTLYPADIKLVAGTDTWRMVNNDNEYRVSITGSGVVESALDRSGNLTISGTLSQGSSRSYKTNIHPIDIQSIVDKLAGLPMATWSYLNATDVQHIGPMAEDFYNTFKFGTDEKHIAPGDMAAVALVTVQKLNQDTVVLKEQLKVKEVEISNLQQQISLLYTRMLKLENK